MGLLTWQGLASGQVFSTIIQCFPHKFYFRHHKGNVALRIPVPPKNHICVKKAVVWSVNPHTLTLLVLSLPVSDVVGTTEQWSLEDPRNYSSLAMPEEHESVSLCFSVSFHYQWRPLCIISMLVCFLLGQQKTRDWVIHGEETWPSQGLKLRSLKMWSRVLFYWAVAASS